MPRGRRVSGSLLREEFPVGLFGAAPRTIRPLHPPILNDLSHIAR